MPQWVETKAKQVQDYVNNVLWQNSHMNTSDKRRDRIKVRAVLSRAIKGALLGGFAGAFLGGAIGSIGSVLAELTGSASAIVGLRTAVGGAMIWAVIGAISTAAFDREDSLSNSASK